MDRQALFIMEYTKHEKATFKHVKKVEKNEKTKKRNFSFLLNTLVFKLFNRDRIKGTSCRLQVAG